MSTMWCISSTPPQTISSSNQGIDSSVGRHDWMMTRRKMKKQVDWGERACFLVTSCHVHFSVFLSRTISIVSWLVMWIRSPAQISIPLSYKDRSCDWRSWLMFSNMRTHVHLSMCISMIIPSCQSSGLSSMLDAAILSKTTILLTSSCQSIILFSQLCSNFTLMTLYLHILKVVQYLLEK